MKNIAIKKEKVNVKPLTDSNVIQSVINFIKNIRKLFLKIYV